MKEFVYSKEDITYKNGTIRKDEIGIIKGHNGPNYIITFVNNNITLELDKSLVSIFAPEQTGDQFSKKVCNVCNRLLDINQFEKNQNGINNRTVRRPSCNDCRTIINGVNMTSYERNKMKKIKPDMEIWTCPICKKTTIPGLTSKVVCDHNHKTGHPRAWICDSCNTGLGRFKDNIELLENAIKYLESYE